jgi:hypothetical protein
MGEFRVYSERWGLPFLYEEREFEINSQDDVSQLIRSMAQEQSATVTFELHEDTSLAICASAGFYLVNFQLDEETTFNLIGDARKTGMSPFVLSGQEVPVPQRYIVSLEQALTVAQAFVRNGSITIDNSWERNVPDGPWSYGSLS